VVVPLEVEALQVVVSLEVVVLQVVVDPQVVVVPLQVVVPLEVVVLQVVVVPLQVVVPLEVVVLQVVVVPLVVVLLEEVVLRVEVGFLGPLFQVLLVFLHFLVSHIMLGLGEVLGCSLPLCPFTTPPLRSCPPSWTP
jgi:hypothetical protein